jgi:hypothetical protein
MVWEQLKTEESGMAESNEREGAAPGERPPASAESPAADGEQAEFLESGRTPPPYSEGPPRPSRWRRWSSNGTVRAGGLTLVAGLVGGLVGGGIVAAFDDDHGDERSGPVRFDRSMHGVPGFRAPHGWAPPDGGGFGPHHRMPMRDWPGAPVPTPTPTPSG